MSSLKFLTGRATDPSVQSLFLDGANVDVLTMVLRTHAEDQSVVELVG